MKILFALLVAAGLIVTGCDSGSSPKPADKKKEELGQNPLNAPTDYLGALAKGKKGSESKLDVVQVNQAISQFQAAEGRNPKSLEELVSEGYLKGIPQPPRGMKYNYNPQSAKFEVTTATP